MKKSKMKKAFSETFKKVAGTEDKRKQGKHTGETDKSDSLQMHYPACGPTQETGRSVQDGFLSTSTSARGSEDDMPLNDSNSSLNKNEPELKVVTSAYKTDSTDSKAHETSESGSQTPRDFGAADLEDSKPGSCFVPCQVLGFPPFHCRTGSLVQDSTKLNVTIATDVEGWDKSVNEQFLLELANNPQVIVTGFVPMHTPKQKDHAKKLKIELVNAKNVIGFPKVELLNYPPDDLDIDILIIHSYGHDLGRQAQIIKDKKKCLWVNVVHTVSEDLEKFSVKKSTDSAENDEITERDLQISLCMESDLILAIGPIVAEALRSALRFSGKDKSVIDLTPGIIDEFLHVRQENNGSGENFLVLLSASSKYFMVKGCDIAIKAINLLKDESYRLIFVRQPEDKESDLKQDFRALEIKECQFTIRQSSGREDFWRGLLCEVDLLIKPSRTEGFGVSGLRAISANLPVLVSGKCGLGKVMKSLHSGAQHVIDSEDPQTWADAIKKVRAKAVQKRREDSEELRKYYLQRFNWKNQCDEIVKKMFSMNANKSESGGQTPQDFEATDLKGKDFELCVEQIEDQAKEVQQYETEVMVNKERAPRNVNPRSKELRLVAEKKINQAEEKANEEMGDALQRGAQELSNVTRKFESKRMDYKQKVKIVQDRTQEVGHAAAKEINKKRSGFDQVDSEERGIPPDGDNKQNPTEDFQQCVEHSEEYGQAIEVQRYETEVMVNKERAPENVNPRSKELRLVAEKKINQTEGNANEEMEDALQRGAQELSIVTRKFVSKRMDYKEEVEIVQDRTQEEGHAAAKDVNKKRSRFYQVDSEGAALDGVNDSESNRDQTGQLVKAQDIPFSVLSKICKELNNKDELSGRVFRLLGKKMGFDKSLTKDLELKVNPTYELLEMWRPNPESTVENLLMILKDDEMEKWDVAAILENWLKKKIDN